MLGKTDTRMAHPHNSGSQARGHMTCARNIVSPLFKQSKQAACHVKLAMKGYVGCQTCRYAVQAGLDQDDLPDVSFSFQTTSQRTPWRHEIPQLRPEHRPLLVKRRWCRVCQLRRQALLSSWGLLGPRPVQLHQTRFWLQIFDLNKSTCGDK